MDTSYGGVQSGEVTIDEVVEDVGVYFKSRRSSSSMLGRYMTEQMGEA